VVVQETINARKIELPSLSWFKRAVVELRLPWLRGRACLFLHFARHVSRVALFSSILGKKKIEKISRSKKSFLARCNRDLAHTAYSLRGRWIAFGMAEGARAFGFGFGLSCVACGIGLFLP
jgi:hypothetical protein